MTEGLKMLKDLQKGLGSMGSMDLNDPQKLLDNMGLDMDKLNEAFIQQVNFYEIAESINSEIDLQT